MVTGKRLDNEEIVKGCYREFVIYHDCSKCIKKINHFIDIPGSSVSEYVDPATIEPVAAKVIWDINKPKCPNCETSLFYYCQNGVAKEFDYCPDCGQRLLWEDE